MHIFFDNSDNENALPFVHAWYVLWCEVSASWNCSVRVVVLPCYANSDKNCAMRWILFALLRLLTLEVWLAVSKKAFLNEKMPFFLREFFCKNTVFSYFVKNVPSSSNYSSGSHVVNEFFYAIFRVISDGTMNIKKTPSLKESSPVERIQTWGRSRERKDIWDSVRRFNSLD